MSTALSAGVSGLQAHQSMLDVAGNNLANVNTTAFKASQVGFSELFSQTLAHASSPQANSGGTNPKQIGSGVGIASISRDMTQGNIVSTGNPLDAAIEGEGFFVLNDGQKDIYTRSGTFSVDADSKLVDAATGYHVQRYGAVGEMDNFQVAGNSDITIPYDISVAPKPTELITLSGNLSADQSLPVPQTQIINSTPMFTLDGITRATPGTALSALYGFNGGTFDATAAVNFDGFRHDGSTFTGNLLAANGAATLGQLVTEIDTQINALGGNYTVELYNGRLKVTDESPGFSQLDLNIAFDNPNGNDGDFALGTFPKYFEYAAVGGTEVKDVNIPVYDHQGTKYNAIASFARSDVDNQWDFVLNSITGPGNAFIEGLTTGGRRVSGLTFNESTGAYAGLNTTIGDSATFSINFGDVTDQNIALDFGTAGQFTGLTQVAGLSTAVATDQDGYPKGDLSSVSIDNGGYIKGTFTNGIRKDVALLQLALFDNPVGLESTDQGFYITSGNSGDPTSVQARTQGAGKIQGSALEKSNADVTAEFVTLMQAQNGYQANARTISVANDILKELANLVR